MRLDRAGLLSPARLHSLSGANMLKSLGLIVVMLLVGLGILLLYPRTPSEEPPEHLVVEIRDFYFDPPGLLIRPGDEVEWVWREITVDGHTTTAYHPAYGKEQRIPQTAEPWDSSIITEMEVTFARTFTVPGLYDYYCLPHEYFGMVGRLVVLGAEKPIAESANHLPERAQTALPSMGAILGPEGQIFYLRAKLNAIALTARRNERREALQLLEKLIHSFIKRNEATEILGDLEELRGLLAREANPQEIEVRIDRLKAKLALP